jgi:hypothetical protein
MHDYDCEFVWDYENSAHEFIDECLHNDDEDYYERSENNYETLAYKHYA